MNVNKYKKSLKYLLIINILLLIFVSIIIRIEYIQKNNKTFLKEKENEELNLDEDSIYIEGKDENYIVCIFKSKVGINFIKMPDGNIIYCNGNKKVAVDYKVELGEENYFEFKDIYNNTFSQTAIYDKYDYTGAERVVKLEAGTYNVFCYGARGGNGYGFSAGGNGGCVAATIDLIEQTTFYFCIGQKGQDGNARRESYNGGAIGGYDTYGRN